jgi:hypothetical protein
MGAGIQLSSAPVSLHESVLQCNREGRLKIVFVPVGADFAYCENVNDLLEVEWEGGHSEMTEEEYARRIITGINCVQRWEVDTFGLGSWGWGTYAARHATCRRWRWRAMSVVCLYCCRACAGNWL